MQLQTPLVKNPWITVLKDGLRRVILSNLADPDKSAMDGVKKFAA